MGGVGTRVATACRVVGVPTAKIIIQLGSQNTPSDNANAAPSGKLAVGGGPTTTIPSQQSTLPQVQRRRGHLWCKCRAGNVPSAPNSFRLDGRSPNGASRVVASVVASSGGERQNPNHSLMRPPADERIFSTHCIHTRTRCAVCSRRAGWRGSVGHRVQREW